jgi:hypothetical protein
VYITDNAYTREEVLRMEQKILKHFGFRVSMPTMVSNRAPYFCLLIVRAPSDQT